MASLFRKCRFMVFGVTSLIKNGENSTERSANIHVSVANATKTDEHNMTSAL